MDILVPCKLGELFQTYKFDDWVEGKRSYCKKGIEKFLWFDKFVCNTHCLSIPTIHTQFGHYQYDEELGYKEFIPKYNMVIPNYMFEFGNLFEKGFNSSRTGKLFSLLFQDGVIIADIVTQPRYEHIRLKYPLELQYEPVYI